MAKEKALQKEISAHLRSQGCFVMVIQPQAGIPSGTPDIFFCKEGFYGWLEVKASRTSRFQPLQKQTLEKLHKWSYARAVYPENAEEIKAELAELL